MKNAHIRTARDTIRNPLAVSQLGFLRMVSDSIRELLETEEDMVKQMKKEMVLIEKASLHISRGKSGFRFSAYKGPKKKIGITSDADRINILARREYLRQRIVESEIHTRRLRRVLGSAELAGCDHRLKMKMRKYQDAQLDLSRILFTKEQNEWIDAPYSPNPFYQEELKQPTRGNVWMRSKSEAKLGDVLETLGLPYRYDDLVVIMNDQFACSAQRPVRPNRDSYFADFKVPNLCEGITVHEHLGAVHVEKYPDKAIKRLSDYHDFKVYELPTQPVRHSEFTFSLEYELRETQLIRQLIHRMLFPSIW